MLLEVLHKVLREALCDVLIDAFCCELYRVLNETLLVKTHGEMRGEVRAEVRGEVQVVMRDEGLTAE